MNAIKLGVNIDHIATLRQTRHTHYPSPVDAAMIAVDNGADSITLHLREDRRHIQEYDVEQLKACLTVPMNLEMAVTEEMLGFAEKIRPAYCCLVPEKREELTTEGGLDVCSNQAVIQTACQRLADSGIVVSLFVDPLAKQIDAAKQCGAPVIELHTGEYAEQFATKQCTATAMERLKQAACYAQEQDLIVNAGHGLDYNNLAPIIELPHLNELNIGHSIICDAVFLGMAAAVKRIKTLITMSAAFAQ